MATLILYMFNLLIYSLIWIKLIITNHWTIGKKLLVGLIGSMIWYQGIVAYLVIIGTLILPIKIALLYSLPFMVMGLFTAFAIYKKELG